MRQIGIAMAVMPPARPSPARAVLLGVALIVVGALLIPCDPALEEAWDSVHEGVPARYAAHLLSKSAQGYANLVILVCILCALSGERRARVAKAYGAAAVACGIICEGAKWTIGRGRPHFCGEINLFDPLTALNGLHSFPSGHSSNAALIALFLALIFPRATKAVLAWAFLVGLSRVTLDSHFFGDVIAGWGVAVVAYVLAVRHWGLQEQRGVTALGGPGEEAAGQASSPTSLAPAVSPRHLPPRSVGWLSRTPMPSLPR